MTKYPKYTVVRTMTMLVDSDGYPHSSEALDRLEKGVNALFGLGYELVGGPFQAGNEVCQAMVKPATHPHLAETPKYRGEWYIDDWVS